MLSYNKLVLNKVVSFVKNRSNRLLMSAIGSRICTRFGRLIFALEIAKSYNKKIFLTECVVCVGKISVHQGLAVRTLLHHEFIAMFENIENDD